MRSETERAVGQAVEHRPWHGRRRGFNFNGSDSVDGGPSSGLAGFPEGNCSRPSVIMHVRGAAASASTSLLPQLPVLFSQLEPAGLSKSKRTPHRPRKEGIAFEMLALGVGFIFLVDIYIYIYVYIFFEFRKYL